ncbi:20238_t:CDS:1, partial [Dentiscutata erythropus]
MSKNLKVARLKNVEREIKKLNDELRGFEILQGFEKHEKNECNICLVEDECSTFK